MGYNELVKNLNCMIDLHLHLDGAISIDSAKKLADLQNIDIPNDDKELANLIQVADDCSDLNEFLERFAFPCSLLQTKEGIKMAVLNLANELKNAGVMYAEVRYAPQLLCEKGLSQDDVVLASIEAAKEAPIKINLILCCMRGTGNNEANMETARLALKYLNQGVVAIDLAGAEALFPTTDYADIFAFARDSKLPITLHAGEADGPNSVRKALEFGAVRIGHGVRSLEDLELVNELKLKQIPLEICPTSNINTAIFSKIEDYPIRKLLDAGLFITINTDDPAIEATDIKCEYSKLINAFNFNKEEIKTFLTNAAKASFADDSLKEAMLKEIEKELS